MPTMRTLGQRRWRFETVPGPGEPGHETWTGDSWKTGGAPAWITGSYDPELNLVYWPTGNPSPSDYGGERAGDNLYSNSMLALDADTGKLKWYFQFTPHDLYDYDATQVPVLLDADWEGQAAQVVGASEPQRFPLCARPDGRQVSQGCGVRAGDVGQRNRSGWQAGAEYGPETESGRESGVPWCSRAHELVFAFL